MQGPSFLCYIGHSQEVVNTSFGIYYEDFLRVIISCLPFYSFLPKANIILTHL